MLPARTQSRICWQCLRRAPRHQTRPNHAQAGASIRHPGAAAAATPLAPPIIQQGGGISAIPILDPLGSKIKIRDLLLQWERDNPTVRFDSLVPDVNSTSSLSNLRSSAEVPDNSELRRFVADSGGNKAGFDELVSDSLVSGHIAKPGELVEVKYVMYYWSIYSSSPFRL